MRLPALAPSLVLLAALPLSLACRPGASTTTEGTTYRVTGALTASACSPGLEPIDPLAFDAEVRSTAGILYWRLGRGVWIPGTIASDGTFRVASRTPVEALPPYRGTDPELDPPRPGCTLIQTETIAGRFSRGGGSSADVGISPDAGPSSDGSSSDAGVSSDAGSHDAGSPRDAGAPDPAAMGSLTADNTIEISIDPGSDCTPLLVENGGSFPTLPCTVVYALTGTATD